MHGLLGRGSPHPQPYQVRLLKWNRLDLTIAIQTLDQLHLSSAELALAIIYENPRLHAHLVKYVGANRCATDTPSSCLQED